MNRTELAHLAVNVYGWTKMPSATNTDLLVRGHETITIAWENDSLIAAKREYHGELTHLSNIGPEELALEWISGIPTALRTQP